MPKIPSLPEKPYYNSVKAYLSELAKDIAEMVDDPVKMKRFRGQLKKYAKFWQKWKTFEDADQKGGWKPEMGRPECIFNIFSRSYNPLKDIEKEAKILAGSYALCALVHDSQLPHLDKINTDIIPAGAIEETLSAPRNTLEDRIVGNWNSGPDVREIYVIEVFFNRVNVDLRELCKSVENKSKLKSIEQEIQQANKLSDIEFLELTAEKFEERTKKILSKDETWHDLDRSLKGWFDSAIGRLEKLGFKDKAGLLKYFYKNLLHFAEGISIRSFRGFPDPSIVASARKNASELAEKFKDLAQGAKISLEDAKAEIPILSKENEFGTIVELLRKDYWLENEDNLKQEIAKVSQDFINRGLYNSTVCTGKQLQVHFDHLENLFNYIIESLKKDFADIPLSNFKEKLFTIVDEEYKKLIPLAYSHLIQAGLAQKNTLKCIEQQVNKKREKTKQAIETKFAILEKQKATPTPPPDSIFGDTWTIFGIPINVKKLRTKLKSHPILLILCFLAIVLIMTYQLWWPFIHEVLHDSSVNTDIHPEVKTRGDSSPAISTLGPNSPVIVTYEEKIYYGISPEKHATLIAQNNQLSKAIQSIMRELTSAETSPNNLVADTQHVALHLRKQARKLTYYLDEINLIFPLLNDFKKVILHTEEEAPLYRVLGLAQLLEHMAFALTPQVIYTEEVHPNKPIHFTKPPRNFLFTKYCLYGETQIQDGLFEPLKQTFTLDVPQIREFVIPNNIDRFKFYSPKGFDEFLADYDAGNILSSDVIIIISFMTNISLARDGGFYFYPNLPWQATWLKLETRNLLGRTMWFELRNPEHARESWLSVSRRNPIVDGAESANFVGKAPFWDHQ